MGSRNGTLVNDERVVGERELIAGDVLKVGPLVFEVVITQITAPQKHPKVTSIKEAAAHTAEGRPGEIDDVEDWFETTENMTGGRIEETTGGRAPAEEAETREMESVETEEIKLDSTLLNMPSVPRPAPAAEPESQPQPEPSPPQTAPGATGDGDAVPPPHAMPDPSRPGKLPLRPRANDSREAAADVLRKFFNRR